MDNNEYRAMLLIEAANILGEMTDLEVLEESSRRSNAIDRINSKLVDIKIHIAKICITKNEIDYYKWTNEIVMKLSKLKIQLDKLTANSKETVIKNFLEKDISDYRKFLIDRWNDAQSEYHVNLKSADLSLSYTIDKKIINWIIDNICTNTVNSIDKIEISKILGTYEVIKWKLKD